MNRFSSVHILNSLRAYVALALLLVGSAPAHAQTVAADRIRLNAGPCTLDSVNGSPDTLRMADCSVLTTASATNLTLNPTGDLVLQPTGLDVLPNSGYTVNLGALSNKYLTLHAAELWVETLVAQNTIATIGGRVLVAPTTVLTADLAPAGTSITVKHNQMASGDRVYLEANGAVEFMAITSAASGSGPYTYSVTRNLDGSGANQWYAGDAMLNTGTTGNGFIDLYSTAGVLSGSGPTIVGNVRTGTTYNNIAPRWAIGNLNGLYGYGATTYGAAFGDSTATNVTVDATNGFRIRSGTANKLVANTSGDLSLTGAFSIGTAGSFSSGASGYSTGTGWWMDYNGGTPRFRIGNPAGNQLTWDGTTLSVTGNGSGLTSIDGNNITTNTVNVGSLNATGFGDNIIKNGAFEGATDAIGLAGWAKDDGSVGTVVQRACCGTYGPSAMLFNPGNGNYLTATYTAAPALPGQVYRIALDVFATATSTKALHVWVNQSTSTNTDVRRVTQTSATAPDVTKTSTTTVAFEAAITSGWQSLEYTYTVPAGVYWISLNVGDVAGSVSGSTYTGLYFDNVEMQRQIGAGHIKASSITTAKIAAGAVTANEIAAGSVTAAKLSVSSLSAITANLGTVTAGSISGVTLSGATITGGTIDINSGAFTVNSGGSVTAPSIGVGTLTTSSAVTITNGFNVSGGTPQFAVLATGSGGYACLGGTGILYFNAGGCP